MPSTVLVPVQLTAFILNTAVCNSNDSKIAPITQPNYTFLRLNNSLIQPDVLDHVDLHSVSPASINPRLVDLGSGRIKRNRVGVYIHWTLPRVYRSGSAAVASSMQTKPTTPGGATTVDPSIQANRKLAQGYPSSTNTGQNFSAPDFRPVPNRWLVVRRITDMRVVPPVAISTVDGDGGIKEFDAWVVESDRLSNINDFDNPLPDSKDPVDVEVDASPFINPADMNPNPTNGRIIDGQAEIFIGRKTNAATWSAANADTAPCVKPLTVLTSSNPLFPDYQPHNSNVFSICDNFKYTKVMNNDNGATKYLDHATADYTVIGWHSRANDDCLTTDPTKVTVPLHSVRLKDCLMQLKDGTSDISTAWLGLADADTRVLCHATMYGVTFNSDSAPATVLADKAGSILSQKQPLAVGITPLDSLLAFINAHVKPRKPGDPVSTDLVTEMEQDILALQTLLEATDSDVDGQTAALDEMYAQAFAKYDGGTVWNYSNISKDGTPVVPDPTHLDAIRSLNKSQKVLDTTNRELQELRWRLFAQWWNYVSGLSQPIYTAPPVGSTAPSLGTLPKTISDLSARIKLLQGALDAITNVPVGNGLVDALTSDVNKGLNAAGTNAEKGTDERFYQRKDPTLLFGGIKSAWESDFLQPLQVRGDWQLISKSADPASTEYNWRDNFQTYINSLVDGLKLPTTGLTGSAKTVLMELWHLRPTSSTSLIVDVTANANGVIPFFHDENNPTGRTELRGRDRWQNEQPFFPLFIEWEAVYYNIPYKYWSLKERPRFSDGKMVIQYDVDTDLSTINPPIKDQSPTNPPVTDSRTVAGRVLVLPQPSYQLAANVTQILNNTFSGDLDALGIDDNERAAITQHINELEFISAPLSGLTSHLLTLHEGSHVKPTVRGPNSGPIVIQAALDAATPGTFNKEMMLQMDTETTLTPYGNSAAVSQQSSPVKLVTHGQLMFTKINIVDKFGQAICAISNEPRLLDPTVPLPTVLPCLSDTLFPGNVGTPPKINSVVTSTDPSACCVAKLTPSINSPARMNGYFVVPNVGNAVAPWRPCDQWENPIWGWLIVNYADYGLQFFLNDGTFYREVRIGGPTGSVAEPRWLPFEPPRVLATDLKKVLDRDATQLDFLIDQLTMKDNTNYLFAFFDMINQSVEASGVHAPNDYAAFLPAVVGKPLALVNTGWSIEMAGVERLNWSTLNTQGPDIGVVSPGTTGTVYEFPVKFGDETRSFDGMVGYFPAKTNDFTPGGISDPPPSPPPSSAIPSSDLYLNQLFTYFTSSSSSPSSAKLPSGTLPLGDPRISINPSTYQPLRPYYYLPQAFFSSTDAPSINDIHNSKLKVFGMLVDPYTPIHAYSSILPNKTLTLPPWTVQTAMKKMSAFFHVGPILLTNDVPVSYDATNPLTGEYNLTDTATTASATTVPAAPVSTVANAPTTIPAPPPPPTVAIPVVGTANWNWLQPYMNSGEVQYNAFGIDGGGTSAGGASATEIRLEKAPYTGVEGFLQLVKSMVALKDLQDGVAST